LGLSSHLKRLYEPVASPEVDEHTLRRGLRSLLAAYRPGEARVRAVMTRQGQVYLAIAPLMPLPPEVYEYGVFVGTTDLQREHPRLKSTSFIGRSDSERQQLAQGGIFEALLVKAGKILEGMTSNFFYVEHDRAERNERRHRAANEVEARASTAGVFLGTAREDILLGVTRQTVIDVAEKRGLRVKYQPLQLDQLAAIDEAFITSSSRGIVPVVQIDQARIGQGTPGPVTRQLLEGYAEHVLETAEDI
jgi:branched-chain amino acid aminotransferase